MHTGYLVATGAITFFSAGYVFFSWVEKWQEKASINRAFSQSFQWEAVPANFKYAACNDEGVIFVYESKPERAQRGWKSDSPVREHAYNPDMAHDWFDSLISRP